MNLFKKDFISISFGLRKLALVYLLILVVCQAHFFVLSDYPTLTVFFQAIAFDMGPIIGLDDFLPPIFWLILQLLPVFSLLYSTYNYHLASSSYDILKAGSRLKYFLSKLLVGFLILALFNLSLKHKRPIWECFRQGNFFLSYMPIYLVCYSIYSSLEIFLQNRYFFGLNPARFVNDNKL